MSATLPVTRPGETDDTSGVDGTAGRWSLRGAGGRPAVLLPLLPAVLALVLGLVGLDRGTMWRDEAASMVAAGRSFPELWAMLGRVETVHAVYYTLLHAWLQLGDGVVWARVPSVLAVTLATALVGLLGARLASTTVGVVAGLLFALNPSVSYYAQEARSTALVAAAALLATWFLLRALERSPRWWVAYAVACVLLVGLNLLAVLVPVAHAVTLLWRRSPRSVLVRWSLAAVPVAATAAVLLGLTHRQQVQVSWIPAPGLSSLKELAHLLLGASVPVLLVTGLLVVLGALPVARTTAPGVLRLLLWPPRTRLQAFAVPLLVVPPAALLAASLVQPVFVPRYVFPSVAAAALLAAVGVERLGHLVAGRVARPHRTRVAAGVAALVVLVCGLGDLGAQREERTAASRPDDLAAAAAIVSAGARPGDAVVFLPDNRRLVAQVYPDAFDRVRDVALAQGPEQADNLTGRSYPLSTVLTDLASSPRVWAIGRPELRLTPTEAAGRAELDLLRRDFVAVDTPQADGVGITLFVRR